MLPIHGEEKSYGGRWAIREKVAGWLRLILSDPKSRNLFFFLLINLSFAFVELSYGVWTNSLGLISDSFHMFFDCTALLAGLAATIIAKWRADEKFSYGYVRAEVLAGFINGLFLLFIAFFIMAEAVERTFEPPEVSHERLFLISVGGFLVNMVGIFAFQHGGHGHSHGGGDHGHSHGGSNHGHSHSGGATSHIATLGGAKGDGGHGGHGHSHDGAKAGHGHSHNGDSQGHSHTHTATYDIVDEHIEESFATSSSQNQIFQGVFLHILADTLGSVGVIISSGLIHMYGWMIADPICSMFIAVLIGCSVLPLLRDSVGILLQRQPRQLDALLPACYKRVQAIDGVVSVQDPHFWTLCSDVYVGALKLEVNKYADSKTIMDHTQHIFNSIGIRQMYVQIDHV